MKTTTPLKLLMGFQLFGLVYFLILSQSQIGYLNLVLEQTHSGAINASPESVQYLSWGIGGANTLKRVGAFFCLGNIAVLLFVLRKAKANLGELGKKNGK